MKKGRYNQNTVWLVLFELLGETWGIRFSDIQEILSTQKITPVPKAPPFVNGLTHKRGKIITVIDLDLLAGETPRESKEIRIIHLKNSGMDIGLLIKSKVSSELLPEELETSDPLMKEFCGKNKIILRKNVIRKGADTINVLETDELIKALEEYSLNQ
jgi:chemotaxis signal transduction protein